MIFITHENLKKCAIVYNEIKISNGELDEISNSFTILF